MKNLIKLLPILLLMLAFQSCDEDPAHIVDLAVYDIEFTADGIDPNMQDFAGTATITAKVTNIGPNNYVSGENQQGIILYESAYGNPTAYTEVANMPFQNLAAGATITVSYTRNWDISSPSEGEFAPYYRAIISKDPDIYIDGNDQNNDTNITNDELVENGHQINQMF